MEGVLEGHYLELVARRVSNFADFPSKFDSRFIGFTARVANKDF